MAGARVIGLLIHFMPRWDSWMLSSKSCEVPPSANVVSAAYPTCGLGGRLGDPQVQRNGESGKPPCELSTIVSYHRWVCHVLGDAARAIEGLECHTGG